MSWFPQTATTAPSLSSTEVRVRTKRIARTVLFFIHIFSTFVSVEDAFSTILVTPELPSQKSGSLADPQNSACCRREFFSAGRFRKIDKHTQ
jgi:hypothetical protein